MINCKICGSTKNVRNYQKKIFLCNKHHQQMLKNGKILKRTNRDKNEVFERIGYLEMALYNRKQEIIAYVKFDKEDLSKLNDFKWWSSGTGYVWTLTKGQRLGMHRVILNAPKNKDVDHINHDSFDNRKSNLRLCTKFENLQNRLKKAKASSKFKGACWNKARNNWLCSCNRKNVGSFQNERHAALAYDLWAVHLFGNFAKTNFKVVSYG